MSIRRFTVGVIDHPSETLTYPPLSWRDPSHIGVDLPTKSDTYPPSTPLEGAIPSGGDWQPSETPNHLQGTHQPTSAHPHSEGTHPPPLKDSSPPHSSKGPIPLLGVIDLQSETPTHFHTSWIPPPMGTHCPPLEVIDQHSKTHTRSISLQYVVKMLGTIWSFWQ